MNELVVRDVWLEKQIGRELLHLFQDQAAWSQATFGTDAERGPIGALKHLQKEAAEAEAAYGAFQECEDMADRIILERDALTERADCLLLLLDANRRAGSSVLDLILAAQEKMKVNRTRTFPRPTSDVPSEHVKDEHEIGGEG